MREKINLTLPADLIEKVKIQAVREKRAVSEIVEELLGKYLNEQRPVREKGKSKR